MIANKARISFASNVWRSMYWKNTWPLFATNPIPPPLLPSRPEQSTVPYSTYRVKKGWKRGCLGWKGWELIPKTEPCTRSIHYSTNTVHGTLHTLPYSCLWNKILLIRYSFQDISKELCPDSPGTLFKHELTLLIWIICIFFVFKYRMFSVLKWIFKTGPLVTLKFL
jgi:hypothetical protein